MSVTCVSKHVYRTIQTFLRAGTFKHPRYSRQLLPYVATVWKFGAYSDPVRAQVLTENWRHIFRQIQNSKEPELLTFARNLKIIGINGILWSSPRVLDLPLPKYFVLLELLCPQFGSYRSDFNSEPIVLAGLGFEALALIQ